MSEQATFHLGTGEFNLESTGCKREKVNGWNSVNDDIHRGWKSSCQAGVHKEIKTNLLH